MLITKLIIEQTLSLIAHMLMQLITVLLNMAIIEHHDGNRIFF